MATLTTTYSFSMPLVGGDADVWGTMLNENWDDLDERLTATFDSPAAGHLGTLKTSKLPTELGTSHTVTQNTVPHITFENGTVGAASLKFKTSDGTRYFGLKSNTFRFANSDDLLTNIWMTLDGTTAEFAGVITGDGSGLTDLDADELTSGTVSDARISGSYTGFVNLTGSGNLRFANLRCDNGPDVNVAGEDDTNTGIRFPAGADGTFFLTSNGDDTLRVNTTGVHIMTGSVLSGNGSGLTDLDASELDSGTVAIARFPSGASARSWVLEHIADGTAGDVGMPALMYSSTSRVHNATAAGSTLEYSSADGEKHGGSPSGTWICLGQCGIDSDANRVTLWLRIS